MYFSYVIIIIIINREVVISHYLPTIPSIKSRSYVFNTTYYVSSLEKLLVVLYILFPPLSLLCGPPSCTVIVDRLRIMTIQLLRSLIFFTHLLLTICCLFGNTPSLSQSSSLSAVNSSIASSALASICSNQ